MMNKTITFINELGNEIIISVSSKEIEGVEGVLLSIEGPTSISENHITKKEAENLYQCLGGILK